MPSSRTTAPSGSAARAPARGWRAAASGRGHVPRTGSSRSGRPAAARAWLRRGSWTLPPLGAVASSTSAGRTAYAGGDAREGDHVGAGALPVRQRREGPGQGLAQAGVVDVAAAGRGDVVDVGGEDGVRGR
ncbi:hypothetical protein [Streptomyces sp. NPDC026673]|uniref:hypothetical protein n=1 Tax=Streptomyces sp. NPDC026673 TaxID=3155724 RepID=UPI0033E29CED